MALQAGVSPEGQKLFSTISKTIPEITWNGANIVVFDNVTIRPPYKVDNVHGNTESGAYKHVKKVVSILKVQNVILYCKAYLLLILQVEKHIKDTEALQQAQQQREQQPPQKQKGGAMQ